MSDYQQAEEKGRAKFLKWAQKKQEIQVLELSTDPSSSWDAKIISGNTYFVVEIKDRDCKSDAYPDFLLEKKKYDNLKSTFPDKQLLYFNTFFDDKVLMWDITEIKNKLYTKYFYKSTIEKHLGKEKKQVYYLHYTKSL
jgi:hypothetical protein